MKRRRFLSVITTGAGWAAAGAVGAVGAVHACSPAVRAPARGWQPIGRERQFAIDSVTETIIAVKRDDWSPALRQKSVYVWRATRDEIVVFSRHCTDLGCLVSFDRGSQCFFCPCHGGIFAKNGERMAGPPKRALYRYATRIQDGRVEIDLDSLPPVT
jgi:menaquinol-cytochrome c reductase iron-sulfur subunit